MLSNEELYKMVKDRITDEVIGVILVGSQCRGYGDSISDYDLEFILRNDSYKYHSGENMHVEINNCDIEIFMLQECVIREKLKSDMQFVHWCYQEAKIIYDRDGSIQSILDSNKVFQLTDEELVQGLKIMWYDFKFFVFKAKRLLKRGGSKFNLNFTCTHVVTAAVRIVFFIQKKWVPSVNWTYEELKVLDGFDGDVLKDLEVLLETQTEETIDEVYYDLIDYLLSHNYDAVVMNEHEVEEYFSYENIQEIKKYSLM